MNTQEHLKEVLVAIALIRSSLKQNGTISEIEILPESLLTLQRVFGLSSAEISVLLLCTAAELDNEVITYISQKCGSKGAFNFGFALNHIEQATLEITAPKSPLRRWRMIESDFRMGSLRSPIRLDERIFHYILGVNQQDERLAGYISPVAGGQWLPPDFATSAQELVNRIHHEVRSHSLLPALVVSNARHGDAEAFCSYISEKLGSQLFRLDAVPSTPEERETLRRLWLRETLMTNVGLFCPVNKEQVGELPVCTSMAESSVGLVFFEGDTILLRHRRQWIISLGQPTQEDQYAAWKRYLGKGAQSFNGQLDQTVQQFNLGLKGMEHAAHDASMAIRNGTEPGEAVWNSARNTAKLKLGALAQKIEVKARWEHLVIPDTSLETLRNLTAAVQQRYTVYQSWGFEKRDNRGLGVSALFHGPSGTGKTMAAEVIAHELLLDLYRIDLSAVVSKYIGETEKNLKAVFDGAEEGGAILLFDEADALFGKRTEVRDSHDRYANIEVGYLLQKMESFNGLAILTTNMKTAFDESFLRRIRYSVEFPFPSFDLRLKIWKSIFPEKTPIDHVECNKLARLTIPGGNIRNIALQAAFLAADENTSISMNHLLRSAKVEYTKLDRQLTNAEIMRWEI